jgi:protocatechuate 3,4-dioxygenase beta subunit
MATVRLTTESGSVKNVFADSAGNFHFKSLAAGNYRLSAARPEFTPSQFVNGREITEQQVTLHHAQDLTGIQVQLTPLGVIAGTVYAEDGNSASGVIVAALLATEKNGTTALSQVARTATDDLGSYRLHGLRPGRYYVRVSARGNSLTASADSRTINYPHALDQAQASAVTLGDGSVLTGIDLNITTAGIPRDAPYQPSPSNQSTTIRGVVSNSSTGGPVVRARVMLSNAEGAATGILSVTSDAAGNFSFRGIRPGQYRLRATRAGFLFGSASSRSSSAGLPITVGAAQDIDNAEIKLTPQGIIAGKVFEGTAPVSNAIVIAARSSRVDGKTKLAFVSRTYSNDLGEYRLFDLPPGRYYIGVSYHGGIAPGTSEIGTTDNPQEPSHEDYVTTLYPEALSLADAVPLDVTPGSVQTSIDVGLFRMRKLRLSGQLIVPSDVHFFSSLTAVLLPDDSFSWTKFSEQKVAIDQRTGSFRADGVAPGRYILAVDAIADDPYAAAVPISVSKTDVDGVEVLLNRAFQVRGRVKLDDNQDHFDFSSLTVTVQGVGAGGRSATAPVNADGSFRLQNLQPDHYSLRISGLADDCYLKNVSVGSAEESSTDIPLTGRSALLELLLRAEGGSVTGTVVDDQHKRFPSAVVVLIPEPPLRERTDLYKVTTSDAEGEFQVHGIPPGDYKLFAWDQIQADAYVDANVLAPFEDIGRRISVQESDKSKAELSIISNAGTIE